jgi:hypothetical protein
VPRGFSGTADGPRPLSGRFRAALDRLDGELPVRLIHEPLDLLRVLDAFDRLDQEGECVHPNFITLYLMEAHGWPAEAAAKLAYTWDVVVGLRNLDRIRERGEPE